MRKLDQVRRFPDGRFGGHFRYVPVGAITITAVARAPFFQKNSDKDQKNFSWKYFLESALLCYQWRMLHKNLQDDASKPV